MDYDLFYGTRIIVTDSFGNERKCYNAENVALAVDKFFNDNFRGLAEITIDLPDDAELFISIESYAMFFKEVIDFVKGRALMKIHFSSKHGKMFMRMSSSPKLPCKFEEASRFIKYARSVGFEIIRDEDGVIFTIDSKIKKHFRVYAPTIKDSVQMIANIFESVYYRDSVLEKGKNQQ